MIGGHSSGLDIISLRRLPAPPVFSWQVVTQYGHRVLVIIDEFRPEAPSMTVTNAAEDVVPAVLEAALEIVDRIDMVIYRDTEGCFDRLVTEGRAFAGFSPILSWDPPPRDLRAALGYVKKAMEEANGRQ